MYGFEYPKGLSVGRVCLELSLKPFKSLETAYVEGVCSELFNQWMPLLRYASGCAVMLWTADGSEILTYNGRLDDEIEWARYLGLANPPPKAPPHDPKRLGLHTSPRYYMDNPAKITFGDLKTIIETLKRIGKHITGFEISVGATFDPGPEFAISDFKFRAHREISSDHAEDFTVSAGWVRCTAHLNTDSAAYAAYPNGIPEGLSIGEFLGAQYRCFANDLGFDFIWFSNGFGFSRDSWNWTGECFDGESFLPGSGLKVRDDIIKFWDEFTAACPGVRIETRGSNLSTGMDIAAHGSPLREIYRYIPFAPPNSPWAALDAQFGLELSGYMSHIAETPEEGFLYRFYTHDPWWINSPWFDRYDRQPHDIYLPLSVARLDGDLNVTKPCGINFLTADDSFGNLPWRCPTEVIPHLLEAYAQYPDEAGPVTWVYPFAHYHEIGYFADRAGEALFGDWFIKSGLDEGMPLGSVISDSNFIKAARRLANRTIAVMPVPDAGSGLEYALSAFLEAGGDALLYGPADHASENLLKLIGVIQDTPCGGKFKLESSLQADKSRNGVVSDVLLHETHLSGGGIGTRAGGGSAVLVNALHESNGAYAYATFNTSAGPGRMAWVRGSFPAHGDVNSRLPRSFDVSEYFMPGAYLRSILAKFGITLEFSKYDADDSPPMILYKRHMNALYITGYAPDTIGCVKLAMPDGAPIMTGTDCIVEENTAQYNLPRWWHNECRTFVKQSKCGKVSNIVKPSVFPGTDRRMYLTGLVDAEVTFYRVPGKQFKIVAHPYSKVHGDHDKYLDSNIAYEEQGGKVVCRGVTGSLMISWGDGESYQDVYKWNDDMTCDSLSY